MAVRPIDAVQVLHNINLHHKSTPVSEFESGFNNGLNQAIWEITHAPTLTQPSKDYQEAFTMSIAALRGPAREQVEKMRGEWIDCDGGKVPVDKYGQPLGWAMCSACGEYLTASDEYPCTGHFCPNCGAPMTDKAVDMVMERLEEVQNDQ